MCFTACSWYVRVEAVQAPLCWHSSAAAKCYTHRYSRWVHGSIIVSTSKIRAKSKFHIASRDGMTSQTGMCMHYSRDGVCGNNAVQFQSCDGSSYCTVIGENSCTDIVFRQMQDSCSYQISAYSEAISSRDTPIVPHVWTWHKVRCLCRKFSEGTTRP